ncbi:MAG: LptF/LptG family permease [Candidatus Delongbacteria bacterium]|nr:LptF/LptG family permease [Candidatus Delongbacteria bacterium]
MLKILDRYIIREFINVLIVSLFAFISIFLIVDFLDFADNLIEKQARAYDVVKYYLLFIPYIYFMISPPAMLMASLFSFSRLSRRSEIIAIRSSGLSILRILAPIILIGMGMVALNTFLANWIIPGIEYRRFQVKQYQIYHREDDRANPSNQLVFRDKNLNYYYFNFYNPAAKTGYYPVISQVEKGRISRRLAATRAIVSDTAWTFIDLSLWEYDSSGQIVRTAFYPQRTDSSFRLQPELFIKPVKKIQHMNKTELQNYIELLEMGGQPIYKALMELYLRISFPFANFVTVLFGAPLAIRHFRKGSASVGFTISLVICFVYYGMQRVFQSIGGNGVFDPFWSAWLSNMVFAGIGLTYVFYSNR